MVLPIHRVSTPGSNTVQRDGMVLDTRRSSDDTAKNEDAELLRAFTAGSEAAFVELYKRRHVEIYRFILQFLHGDEDMASDVFQDTFVKVHQHAHTLRDTSNVRAWMYAIARNNCLNLIKRNGRQVRLDEEHADIEDIDMPLPDVVYERDHLRSELDRAIAALPENQREAVVLREYEGMSYQEIAEATRTNVGVVRQRLWRAKQSLRNKLAVFFPEHQGDTADED